MLTETMGDTGFHLPEQNCDLLRHWVGVREFIGQASNLNALYVQGRRIDRASKEAIENGFPKFVKEAALCGSLGSQMTVVAPLLMEISPFDILLENFSQPRSWGETSCMVFTESQKTSAAEYLERYVTKMLKAMNIKNRRDIHSELREGYPGFCINSTILNQTSASLALVMPYLSREEIFVPRKFDSVKIHS